MEISQRIKNNAICAYLMFWISISFLFVRKNEYINNNFVKNHTKSAILIHFLLFLNIFIFKFNKIFSWIQIFNYEVNFLVFSWISTILFLALFIWIYKAYKWDFFKIWEFIKSSSEKNLIDINKDSNLQEKDKVTFILAFIPFFWQIFTSKYDKNENIKEILRLNTLFLFIYFLLFLNNHNNLNLIFLLIYLIFVAFVWVNLFVKWELLTINLWKNFSFSEILKNFKIFCKYMKNYITWNFVEFKILKEEENKKISENELKTYEEMKNLPDLKWPKKIIYFPIINLFFIFFKENKYQIHIRNGLTLSFLFIIFIILWFFKIISYKYFILFLFPISFWIWNLGKNFYKIPLVYDIFSIFKNFINFFRKSKKFISEKRKEVHEVSMKVWEKIPEKTEKIETKEEK